jgi:hypothetical protein
MVEELPVSDLASRHGFEHLLEKAEKVSKEYFAPEPYLYSLPYKVLKLSINLRVDQQSLFSPLSLLQEFELKYWVVYSVVNFKLRVALLVAIVGLKVND